MQKLLFYMLIAVGALCSGYTATAGELKVDHGKFVDKQGAEVILRGFNYGYKLYNHRVPPLTLAKTTEGSVKDMKAMNALGANAVRLLFDWDAYEGAAPGVYNEEYLDYYEAAVKAAREQGIYVIVDYHQDAFSRWTLHGCGQGAPQWAIPSGYKVYTPNNDSYVCRYWTLFTFFETGKLNALFDAFYQKGNPARENLLVVYEKIARRLAGLDNVLGYEIMNEPLGSKDLYVQFFVDMAHRVRKIDPTAIMFLDNGPLEGAGVQKIEIVDPKIDNLAYAPHYYNAQMFVFYTWLWGRYEPVAETFHQTAKSLNAAVILAEYGAHVFRSAQPYLTMILDDLDKQGDSGLQWMYASDWTPENQDRWNHEDFSVVDDHGAIRSNYIIRPFVRRVAGHYGSFEVKKEKGKAVANFFWNADFSKGKTEIFIPPKYFDERGIHITSSPNIVCSYTESLSKVNCEGKAEKNTQDVQEPAWVKLM